MPGTATPVRLHRASWRPLRFHNYSRELGTTVATLYGFRGECSCGWVGPVRRTVMLVRLTLHEHLAGSGS